MRRLLKKKNVIYPVVSVIGVLLIVNIGLTYYNNVIIRKNRDVQKEVENVRVYYDQIGKSVIHSIDIGLRGFAIVKSQKFGDPLEKGIEWKDSIVQNVELSLTKLNYDFTQYNIFKDSLDSYIKFSIHLKQLLLANEDQKFRELFSQDRGAHLWWMYLNVDKDIQNYINRVYAEAQDRYDAALFRNQIIQVVLFLLCVPTLAYTAYYTIKNFRLSELLRNAEEERNRFLQEQNLLLEEKVKERTQEISSQNEEILAQREALTIQNKQLYEAQKTIELQHAEIHEKNEQLKTDVITRTQELREANKQLLEQNNQLEQFAFIAAHNLRAPLTRILGLANLIQMTSDNDDRALALDKLVTSTRDLDQVIRDMNTILNIKRQTENLTEVHLETVLQRVIRTLEKEIDSTRTTITSDFEQGEKLFAVAPYIESIFYNLLSNAIKYRDPDRSPTIIVKTALHEEYIVLSVSDNGLGIDLTKHKQNIFSLYKRFHLHMEGRGLGLYLVKTQVESMGGKVDLKSAPNEGTTFFIYLKRYMA